MGCNKVQAIAPFVNHTFLPTTLKNQSYSASSLDGFLATTDNSLDWLLQFGEAEGPGYKNFLADIGAIAMGSSTNQWLLDHYIKGGTPDEKAWLYTQPTGIFSGRKLDAVRDADLRFVQGAVTPVHQQMAAAAKGKNFWIAGGGELAGQSFDPDLLDELIIQVASVTLGQGLPLLPRLIAFPPLRLRSVQALGEAFAELHDQVPHPGDWIGMAGGSTPPNGSGFTL
ncbi:dihydrofolate reductase [Cyanobium gracile PCC 6307]|uniref:Dihydrofolate reductase n=2 Tax=Cyanobium gracile TaxID=59930 RepID=K9P6R7_CYAGP|nr:dihydrofolate reductase [Cyanobium gracile PCC 6307]